MTGCQGTQTGRTGQLMWVEFAVSAVDAMGEVLRRWSVKMLNLRKVLLVQISAL